MERSHRTIKVSRSSTVYHVTTVIEVEPQPCNPSDFKINLLIVKTVMTDKFIRKITEPVVHYFSLCEISGSHGGDYEYDSLLSYSAV
jgi:hypothetical protein